MLLFALGMFLISLAGSAFFSGTETGFYRASRVKLVMNALDGDRLSKFLVWLSNHPALMVATVLIGNNIANYTISLSVMLAVSQLFVDNRQWVELVIPFFLTPFLYVYGESLPKSLFNQAPNRLLRLVAFPLGLITALLAPAAALLWGLSRLLEQAIGQSPERVRTVLARKELQQILDEGQQAGILHPTQRILSQNFFAVAATPVRQVCTPLFRAHTIPRDKTEGVAIRYAQRFELHELPVTNENQTEVVGYVTLAELLVRNTPHAGLQTLRPLIDIRADEPLAEALLRLQSNRESLARVLNASGQVIGMVTIEQLTDPLLKGPLGSLQR